MTEAKDSLPGVAMFMLDDAMRYLDRAAEATSLQIARDRIAEAQDYIRQVLVVAKQAADIDRQADT
jgi:hypothetical protein